MHYSPELAKSLVRDYAVVEDELQYLLLDAVRAGDATTSQRAREHLVQGAGRRLKTIRRCLHNVFKLFPPGSQVPIQADLIEDTQISLHAFVINIYGLFENLAWSFVLHHDLETKIGDRRNIGIFLNRTQKYMPVELRQYVTSTTITTWHAEYLKKYRDSLAHRIPLYIPPATFTPEEGEQYNRLERGKIDAIRNQEWQRLEEIYQEQATLGKPCAIFLHLHSDSDEYQSPVYLHPQMLCDVKTVLEFCKIFFANWQRSA